MSWFRRGGVDLPPLPESPRVADLPAALLQSGARYLGTASDGRRVTSRGLGGRGGSVRLMLSDDGLDVVRMGGPFRIPVTALRGGRSQDDALVVSWVHGEHLLETAFQLSGDTPAPGSADAKANDWVRKIGKVARKHHDRG